MAWAFSGSGVAAAAVAAAAVAAVDIAAADIAAAVAAAAATLHRSFVCPQACTKGSAASGGSKRAFFHHFLVLSFRKRIKQTN